MLKHKSKYVSLALSQQGADTIDRTIDELVGEMKDENGKYPKLTSVQVVYAGVDRFFITVLAEG